MVATNSTFISRPVLYATLVTLSIILLADDSMAAVFPYDRDVGGGGSAAAAIHDTLRYSVACGRLLELIEGPFGALITVSAGIGAIITSAVGGFKVAWTLVVVAVGAFILRAYITLFFAAC